MKRLFIFILLAFVFGEVSAQVTEIKLHSNWQFHKAGENEWLKSTVPGTVHTDLLDNKKIKDPFYRTNEKEIQWISVSDWEYKTNIVVDSLLLLNENIDLVMEGLDTYADVYVNNNKILSANNMFLAWKKPIRTYLKKGNNELRVYFHSPINKVMPAYNSLGYHVPVSNNDQANERVSIFIRKAGYHFGWDWGPRLVTSGIWRPIYLSCWNDAKIEDLFIKQKLLKPHQASLDAEMEVYSSTSGVRLVEVLIDEDHKVLLSKRVYFSKGVNKVNVPFELENPILWWPKGFGNQKLYTFNVRVKDGERILAFKQVKKGLRDIEVVQDSHEKGKSFYFKVNGVPIFIKGANYVPQDNFLTRVTNEKYRHVIETADASNINMLRVWGGGIYENDIFYDLCDEKGILVWQDFMFACALYPPLTDLKKNIYDEAVQNVKRLRNHPSIAIWCGNNEIVQFMNENYWGQTKANFRTPADSLAVIDTYAEIFHNILPSALKAYDDEKFYWSSSPNGENYSTNFSAGTTTGDLHYWGVWHGKKPFSEYNKVIPSFMSEYGFQSFPEIESVNKFAIPADFSIDSEVMKAHQRSTIGNGTIVHYMKEMYKVPQRFSDFLYVGQLLQADGIKTAIEAQRRAMPYCMGSIYWQLNDCWPVASWSSMDYYGRWKALQYAVKKAYSEVLISTILEEETVKIYIVSDKRENIKATLRIQLIDFNGKILSEVNKDVNVIGNNSAVYYSQLEKELIKNADKRKTFLKTTLFVNNQQITDQIFYFDLQKNLLLDKSKLQWELKKDLNNYKIILKSDKLIKNLKISLEDENIVFSDNYLDILPGCETTVSFKYDKVIDKKDLSFFSLIDAK
ncbi:glycoside hydrolase family 2 protein [Pedobacter frigiditerrae]|uniref:Beta-mannosidase n=1 Tax=Pedobacter frigiditerrae TaxID=2530452 RepID=A0A4R0MPF4_9SPHI|nr:glycoside hydrolase family 2 protein [Pedobacter frigiditerrae]TCC88729.1 glycoside hydrolase family 2 protein [Pedobacter frigiditerrae]